jgi:hypothetical protein
MTLRISSARLAAIVLALFIAGPDFPVGPARAAEGGAKVAVVAFGLFGDQSVFESEANGAAKIMADRFGGAPVIVRSNTKSRTEATPESLTVALDSAAHEIDADNDILMLILTSHGSRAGLVVKAGARESTLSPQLLAVMLNQTGIRHRVVIISACYSGVFIPHLANENTLVITAADADHPSFGCQDGAQWTYFGEALFNKAMRRAASLRDAFALARTLVLKRERHNGFVPSNPQIAGGRNIDHLLKGSLEHVELDPVDETDDEPIPTANLAPWPVQSLAPWPQQRPAPWPPVLLPWPAEGSGP